MDEVPDLEIESIEIVGGVDFLVRFQDAGLDHLAKVGIKALQRRGGHDPRSRRRTAWLVVDDRQRPAEHGNPREATDSEGVGRTATFGWL